MDQVAGSMKDDRAETELLDALLSEPTIKFGNLMNVIESFERARGSELFFNSNERERTQAFFNKCANDETPKDNAIQIIKMLQMEADRMTSESEGNHDKSDDSIKEVFGDKLKHGKEDDDTKNAPPSSFKDLQERRRTSNEYRIRGMNDNSSSDGSEMDVEESLLVNEKEPLGGDLSVVTQVDEGEPSRPTSRLEKRSASRLSINTNIPTTPEHLARHRAKTAQGVSFPTERILSPPSATFTSGIPRASRRSDPSRPAVARPVASGSRGTAPPSSFAFGSPGKTKSGRARSGSADGSTRIGQPAPGASFGMGVGYSTGIGGISRPPSVARSRRESQETIVDGDMVFDKHERHSTSNRSQPGLTRPRPPRQTSAQRKQPLPFPRSSSGSSPATPGSPDLKEMKLPDVSLLDDQSFVGELTQTAEEYEPGIVQAEADISRMGRGSIADTTMDLNAGMASIDDGYNMYGMDYGEGVGGRRRKISGERMKRISTDSTSSMVIRAKVDQLEGENQELNNKNRVLEDKLTAQGNDNETMQGRMLDLENNLRDETTEKKRLEREIKAKDRENQTALTELEHKLSTTQEQLRDLKSALASSTSTNNKLKDEVQDLTRAIRDKEDEISNLMSDLSELKEDKDSLARDLQDLSQRYDQNTTQLDGVRQHNRELKQQLQQQDELQETINNLNQEVGDLRLRLSHSHARGGTETSTFGAGDAGLGGDVGGMTARTKRSLATELGDGLDEEDDKEEQEAAIGGREEHVQGEDGVTTIYHTTTVRRVVRPRTTSQQQTSKADQPAIAEEIHHTDRTISYTDRSTSPPPSRAMADAFSQTDESHNLGAMLPPYTPRPESEIVSSAIEKVHPKLLPLTDSGSGSESASSDHGHGHGRADDTANGTLEGMAKIAQMYAGLCAEVGVRCEVLEEALKVRQEQVIGGLSEEREKNPSDSALSITEAEAKVEAEDIVRSELTSEIAARVPTHNDVEVKRKSGTLSWIRTLCLVLPAVILGWILAQEYAPPSQDSFARYLLLHIMARGSMPDGFLQGSMVDRDMGGERVVWGRVPI